MIVDAQRQRGIDARAFDLLEQIEGAYEFLRMIAEEAARSAAE